MDVDLKRTIQFLLERNVAVVVHDQQDLNLSRSHEANVKASLKEKENAKASSSNKAKTNAASQVASRNTKAALAQRARRQRERDAKQQLVKRTRQEREELGECMQPTQPRFFPALIPSRRRRLLLERAKTKAIKGDAIQSTSLSTEKTENSPHRTVGKKALVSASTTAILSQSTSLSTENTEIAPEQTVVTKALVSSSTAVLLQEPNLMHNSINGGCLPLVKNVLSQPKQPNQVYLHSLPPSQNLGLGRGRKPIQQGLHFKALGGPASSTPWNFSLSSNGGNKHLINPVHKFKMELGGGKFQDNMGKHAYQLRQCPLKPEICLKQTPMRPKYVHFVPVATTNYRAPVMTFPQGQSSVHESIGKPGIPLLSVQSSCHKATAGAPHSIGSDNKQKTFPQGGQSVHVSLCKPSVSLQAVQSDFHKATADAPQGTFPHNGLSDPNSLGKPPISLHAVQSDYHNATVEASYSTGPRESDDKQRTFAHGGLAIRDSLGKPGINLHAVQSGCHKATRETNHSVGSKGSDDKQRTEQFFFLPNLLKQLDESDQRDYKERLLHLPPTELSQYAVELEKRAVQLTIDEGKEMQRVQDLNILGNVVDYLTIVSNSYSIQSKN